MSQTLTKIKRGIYEGIVTQEENKYFAIVMQDGKQLKKSEPYYDQDEAEIELGALIDSAWREKATPKGKLMRRL